MLVLVLLNMVLENPGLLTYLGLAGGCYLAYSFLTFITGINRTLVVIGKKQRDRDAEFRRLESEPRYKLTAEHEKILAKSNQELVESLQSRGLTAAQVLEAFMAKALKETKELNAVTEFIPQAEEWARSLDNLKELKGPLHGFPISVKDNCNVEGMDSTIGLGKYLNQPAAESSVIVKVMMELGAVPFCKTNVPQTLLSFGCANPIFGLTKNYLNHELTPGGSGGGECTLISSGGSRLGIGSDIGGSVRIPAHFCGIQGIKFTKNRVSGVGYRGSLPNVVGLAGVPGFQGNDVYILSTACKAILETTIQNKYDPWTLPLAWDQQVFSSKRSLRIGYFTSLPYWPLVGDTETVVLKAKAALEAQGHTLVPFDEMPDSFKMMDLVFDFAFADAGEHLLRQWKDEPIPRSVMVNFLICKSPMWFRKILVGIMGCPWVPLVHSTRAISIIGRGANRTGDLWQCIGDTKKMTQDLMDSWMKANLDLLLTPTFPFPAVPHHLPGRLSPSVIYTMIWNLFDFPAGCVKFGTESGSRIDEYDDQGDMVLRTGKAAAKKAVGMPISVQLVGLPYQEELVLRGMEQLSAALSPDH